MHLYYNSYSLKYGEQSGCINTKQGEPLEQIYSYKFHPKGSNKVKNSPLVTVALADLVLFQAVVPLLQCGIISKFCIKSLQRFLLMKVYYENFHTRMKTPPSKIPIFCSINPPKIFIFHNFFTGGVVGKNLHPERNLTSRVFKRPKLLKIREIENCKEFA